MSSWLKILLIMPQSGLNCYEYLPAQAQVYEKNGGLQLYFVLMDYCARRRNRSRFIRRLPAFCLAGTHGGFIRLSSGGRIVQISLIK